MTAQTIEEIDGLTMIVLTLLTCLCAHPLGVRTMHGVGMAVLVREVLHQVVRHRIMQVRLLCTFVLVGVVGE